MYIFGVNSSRICEAKYVNDLRIGDAKDVNSFILRNNNSVNSFTFGDAEKCQLVYIEYKAESLTSSVSKFIGH